MKILLFFSFNLLFLVASGQPSYKGGRENLDFTIKNSLIYPEYSKQNCLQGTVQVSFKLDKKGHIFGSRIFKGFGTDLDDEALRIIRLTSGKWIVPADHDTSVAIIIPINFSLKEYNCERASSDDIKAAISAYKARADLTRAILNFYDNKLEGQYKPEDERKIEQLKEQLGYDERYATRLIRQAKQKLKQGDHDGACEDFNFVRRIGSHQADKYIEKNCR